MGSYGPMIEESRRITVSASSIIKFTERKNTAYDVWVFVRGVEAEENVPIDWWPKNYDQHLTRRPDAPLLGCTLCTEFR